MTSALAARASSTPLPTGIGYRKITAQAGAAPAWPGAENWLLPGDGQDGGTRVFNRPERFWLRAGGFCICTGPAAWTRYDYELRLCVNGPSNYGNDLNGINFFQKANAAGGGTTWWGTSIESLWFCEANTDYMVYFLSKGNGASCQYYQHQVHWGLWAYTIGEGVY